MLLLLLFDNDESRLEDYGAVQIENLMVTTQYSQKSQTLDQYYNVTAIGYAIELIQHVSACTLHSSVLFLFTWS